MITDAKWDDMNGDGTKDLITCGDWNSINIFNNKNGELIIDSSFVGNSLKGWWFSIETADLNNDGKMDIIAGNLGKNSKLNHLKKLKSLCILMTLTITLGWNILLHTKKNQKNILLLIKMNYQNN
jgi:hypothetical protein